MKAVCIKDKPVTVVSVGTDYAGVEVARCIRRLGYTVMERDDLATVAETCSQIRSTTVVVLGRLPGPARSLAEKLLGQLSASLGLGILAGNPRDWDNRLLARCPEFCIWPCSDEEIAVRLDRLWDRLAGSGVDAGRLNDTLLELNLIGRAPAFVAALERVRRFAGCAAPVLIEGETGTGKELFARAFHYLSDRREYPFIPVNCGALPDHLLENELFGHERGAFTDAGSSYSGLVSQADKGTLFLDEVEALSPRAQIVLLRFLQAQEYRPLGATRLRNADVRVIAASNESLSEAVRRGALREDLLFRMDVMRVQVPPLRERRGDIELLAEHFMRIFRQRYAQPGRRLHPDSLEWMRNYDWPGNVRELENLVHREFMLSENDLVRVGDQSGGENLSPTTADSQRNADLNGLDFRRAKAEAVARFEQRYLEELMERARGNVSLAARIAGKERSALGKLLKKHRIDRAQFC